MSSGYFKTAGENGICKDKFKELNNIYGQAAIFTSIWKGDTKENVNQQESICSSDSDSRCEKEENVL